MTRGSALFGGRRSREPEPPQRRLSCKTTPTDMQVNDVNTEATNNCSDRNDVKRKTMKNKLSSHHCKESKEKVTLEYLSSDLPPASPLRAGLKRVDGMTSHVSSQISGFLSPLQLSHLFPLRANPAGLFLPATTTELHCGRANNQDVSQPADDGVFHLLRGYR